MLALADTSFHLLVCPHVKYYTNQYRLERDTSVKESPSPMQFPQH